MAKARASAYAGRTIEDNNEADAICLLEYAAIKYGLAIDQALKGGG